MPSDRTHSDGTVPANSPTPALPLHRTKAAAHTSGRHELGQNFLTDRRVINAMVDAIPHDRIPVLELGAGDGAVTAALLHAGRAVTAVEVDSGRAAKLRRRHPNATVVAGDMLAMRAGSAHHVVSNVPFGITTPLLRHLLPQEHWQSAVLLVQWEVARKRAGVGGTTLLTAQWWPWVDFALLQRVPARAFRPVPSVDGGLLMLRRRPMMLVADADRAAYQGIVRRVFDDGSVLRSLQARLGRRAAGNWLAAHGLQPGTLARALSATQWGDLYQGLR
jgi:23S rRNA (adenine-N6)-dimethyltransferase